MLLGQTKPNCFRCHIFHTWLACNREPSGSFSQSHVLCCVSQSINHIDYEFPVVIHCNPVDCSFLKTMKSAFPSMMITNSPLLQLPLPITNTTNVFYQRYFKIDQFFCSRHTVNVGRGQLSCNLFGLVEQSIFRFLKWL